MVSGPVNAVATTEILKTGWFRGVGFGVIAVGVEVIRNAPGPAARGGPDQAS